MSAEELLRRALESGQLRDTLIGEEIAEYFSERLLEYSYTVHISNVGEERALARNEIENLLRDHVTQFPHFDEYLPICINVMAG